MYQIVRCLLQHSGTEGARAGEGLLILPGGDLLRVAGEEDFGNFPAVEFGGTGIDGRGQETVLEGVGKGARLVAQGPGKEPHHGVGDDGRRELTAREDVVANRDFTCYQMLADAMVDAFVVTAEYHQVLLAGQLVGHLLGQLLAVGRSEDYLIVSALGLELLHQRIDRLDHHHHPRVAAETVIIDLAVAALAVFADVVDVDFDQAFVLSALDDGIAQRAFEQLGHYGKYINSHRCRKISDYFQKKTIFASYI